MNIASGNFVKILRTTSVKLFSTSSCSGAEIAWWWATWPTDSSSCWCWPSTPPYWSKWGPWQQKNRYNFHVARLDYVCFSNVCGGKLPAPSFSPWSQWSRPKFYGTSHLTPCGSQHGRYWCNSKEQGSCLILKAYHFLDLHSPWTHRTSCTSCAWCREWLATSLATQTF